MLSASHSRFKISFILIPATSLQLTYKGVYIQDMLSRAGVTMGSLLRGGNLSKYVLAVCADGYRVVYSLAELDSSFVRDLPIIACLIDGQALNSAKGPLRVIMPGDKKPARNCFQLKELIVRSASN
ncbi:molybdopterin-dependent oxidoreductase [Arachidicoccus terrestris]|uniref:molybdopterin-dependent oxidoreductase n=1 Tax=Arachidicoccus terrestris TaxID=2875539 RepID=UPI001CC7C5CC|nr:molybdopterin-dependent oxidoreductase [Arachidicoccus terrestris]UAY56057.1 molybdopterin-dependent oxidoreductase [Arachidicoccus terrestris]